MEARKHVVWAIKRVHQYRISTCGEDWEKGQDIMPIESHKSVIFYRSAVKFAYGMLFPT